jgi:hypothetical protein
MPHETTSTKCVVVGSSPTRATKYGPVAQSVERETFQHPLSPLFFSAMNNANQTPRIHTNGETFLICANEAGFVKLRDKITYLLENDSAEISLRTIDPNDISAIHLDNTISEPKPQSALSTLFIATILISFLASSIIGVATIIDWIS